MTPQETSFLSAGTMLASNRYRIVRHIASGGFGNTYEAIHVLLNRRLAIKEFFPKDFCLRDEHGTVSIMTQNKVDLVTKLRKKFMDEARALFALEHPNIVHVHDVFEEHGTAYFAMDYIDGPSLSQIIAREGPLTEERVLRYAEHMTSALTYIHNHHCSHLDIKPDNIMVDSNDNAVLIDFGVAKQYEEANGENTSTLIGLTPGYAPPEQMSGDVRSFSPTADIYALAATFYKVLTGETPPSAASIAIGEKDLPPFPYHISEGTQNAIIKAMETKWKKRPQTAEEFFKLLKEGVEEAPKASPGKKETAGKNITSPVYPPKKTKEGDSGRKPSKKRNVAIILLMVLLIGGAGAFFAFFYNGNPGTDTATTQEDVANKQDSLSQASYMEAVKALRTTGEAAKGLETLQTLSGNGHADATYLLSRLYFQSRLADDYMPDSIVMMRKNLNIKPDNTKAHNLLKMAVEQNPDNYFALYELACDYWKASQRTEAVPKRTEAIGNEAEKLYLRALSLAKKQNDTRYINMIKGFLPSIEGWKKYMQERNSH